jgi:hypothetical protein
MPIGGVEVVGDSFGGEQGQSFDELDEVPIRKLLIAGARRHRESDMSPEAG